MTRNTPFVDNQLASKFLLLSTEWISMMIDELALHMICG